VSSGIALLPLRPAPEQQASDAAGELGLYILVIGNDALDAVVTGQSEGKNTQVPVGTTIKLRFADTKAAD
jgi:hypothetical protein